VLPDIRLFALVISNALIIGPPATAADRPPNMVVFLVDDLGWTDLGCFGSTFYETPSIDALAESGMRFTVAYAACPVCSPTRASIFTGRYPQRFDVTNFIGSPKNQPDGWPRNTRLLPAPHADRLSLDEVTLAEALRGGGYATFFSGKWHLGPRGFWPEQQGFDVNKGGVSWGSPRSYFSPYDNPRLSDGPQGEHLPQRLARETCEFIAANAERPFLAYVSFYSVHIPLRAPQELIEKYEAKAAGMKTIDPSWGRERDSKVRLVQNHSTYAAMIESMDRAVGMVLDQLEELKLTGNTVVLFTSDNGGVATSEGHPTANAPLRAGKGWLYDGGIRVPTILRWPGVTKPGSTCSSPIISVDYFPTLMEAAGVSADVTHEIDGQSIVPLLRGETLEREPLFLDYPHYGNQGGAPAAAVRDGRWKLIHWYEDHSVELFDVEADPSETTNLAGKHPDVVRRLRRSLDGWRQSVGAKPPTPNPNYK
jgi:arylsulfatase A-like enzyme